MKTITCKICNKECKNNIGLVSHIAQIHNKSIEIKEKKRQSYLKKYED